MARTTKHTTAAVGQADANETTEATTPQDAAPFIDTDETEPDAAAETITSDEAAAPDETVVETAEAVDGFTRPKRVNVATMTADDLDGMQKSLDRVGEATRNVTEARVALREANDVLMAAREAANIACAKFEAAQQELTEALRAMQVPRKPRTVKNRKA